MVGILVSGPDVRVDGESFPPFDLLAVQKTQVALWVELPDVTVTRVSREYTALRLGDDSGSCAGCKDPGTWGTTPAKIALGDRLCSNGHCALVTVAASGRPAAPSSRLVLKGDLAFETGSAREKATVQVALTEGAKFVLGTTTYHVTVNEADEGWRTVRLSADGMLNLHSVLRATVGGQEVESQRLSSWEERRNGKSVFGLDVTLHTVASTVALEVEFTPVLQVTKVPIDFTFSIGSIHAGPTEPGAWEPFDD